MPRRKRKYEEIITVGFSDDGKRIRKYIGSDSKAEFDRLKRAAIIESEKIRNPSEISLYDYAKKWAETYKGKRSIATRDMYDNSIKKLKTLRFTPIKDVTPSQLQQIVNANWQYPDACKKFRLMLKQVYAQAIRDGIIYPRNLAEEIDLPPKKDKEIRFFSDKEMDKIVSGTYTAQDRLYLEVLRNTGMRPSEALALQWQDIDLNNLEIKVCRSFEFDKNNPRIKPTKTYRDRVIPITSEFASTLRQMPKSGVFVFTYNDGRPMTKSVYRKMSARILKAINKSLGGTDEMKVTGGMTMYSFRHTYATNLYYNAVKPGIISTKMAAAIMGHSEEIFLKRYCHLVSEKEQMDALRNVLSGTQKGCRKETSTPENGVGRHKGDRKIG